MTVVDFLIYKREKMYEVNLNVKLVEQTGRYREKSKFNAPDSSITSCIRYYFTARKCTSPDTEGTF